MEGVEVKAIRKKMMLTPVQFGAKLGISGSMVEAIEAGKRNVTPGVAAKVIALRSKK